MAQTFPFSTTDVSTSELLELIESYLPSVERATALCEAYLEHCSWVLQPVDREQLFSELLPVVYRRRTPQSGAGSADDSNTNSPSGSGVSSTSESILHPDELALLLMVFAIGALTDLTLPPYNDEAEQYYQLGRTALGLAEIFEQPSLLAVQGVILMAGYMSLSGRRYTLDAAVITLKLAAVIAKCVRGFFVILTCII